MAEALRKTAPAEAAGPAALARAARAPGASGPVAAAGRVGALTTPSAAAGRVDAATMPSAAADAPAAASPALALLRRARAETEARSAIWTWRPEPGASARSFDADAQAWLQRLVYAARGRWADVAERSDNNGADELRWWRNDEPVALLRIEAQGLRWIEPSSRIRFAPMTADELERLRTR
jgi:hypothetical protein